MLHRDRPAVRRLFGGAAVLGRDDVPPALRILHGVLVAVGVIMVAAALWRAPST
ncbi:MAG TPA: hypothetical protein VGO16_19895 [Pseudonocardiaceae bacterium]|nr:hypothetical protein [Pseudonocardiaceae bacterium]